MIVLDTNVISEVFRPQPDSHVVDWLASLDGDVAITAITLAELLAGIRRLPRGRRRSALALMIETALEPYRDTRSILAFDSEAASHYADIVVARQSAGSPISMADAQIAAICRGIGATIATRNVKDFDQTGVDLVDPWTA